MPNSTTTPRWNATDLPDLTGRTAVVTGANSGLGIATVDALAQAGARVALAVRLPQRGEAAAASNATLALRTFGRLANRFFAQDAKAGALPTLYAAVQDLPGASYVGVGRRQRPGNGPPPLDRLRATHRRRVPERLALPGAAAR